MFKTSFKHVLFAVAASVALGGPALAQDPLHDANFRAATPIGPKKSVAVIDVTPTGAFQAHYGSFAAGGGLTAMLETELSRSGQFRIAQRTHLEATLYEQQLGELGLNGARTAKPGSLTGAQFLIRAAVTDFTMSERGGGISIGGTFGTVVGGLSPQMREGRVSIDFQVIDSTSGEVVDAFSVTRKVTSRSVALTATNRGVSVGTNGFANTPLGEATRDAMTEASARIAAALMGRGWSAQVAQVRGDALYVNVGAEGGLRVGDQLRIHRVVDRIVDPATGALLGVEKAEIGQAVISSVQGQYATASFQAASAPMIGDVITLGR